MALLQEAFVDGKVQRIAATSAVGMGIDKPDIRVVLHANVPRTREGSLAGSRTSRHDQEIARCVLL